ncbi:hypothetical protein K06K5_50640 (plasmid) [Vibrio alginolyticus]|nr:hypothetical protein K06K5_50640 [Vibrio alginolyticus]
MKFDKVQDYSCVDKTELVQLESFNKQFCFVFKQPFVKQFLLLVIVGGQIKTISACVAMKQEFINLARLRLLMPKN